MARRKNPKRGRTQHARDDSSASEEEEAQPAPARQLVKKTVAKKKKEKAKSVSELNSNEYWAYRERNPYSHPQDPSLVGRPFWNKDQALVYHDVIKGKKNMYVKTKSVNIEHMQNDPEYFGEALALCEQFDIVKIITFNHDFDPELVAQFYATVYFGTDDARTLTWMTLGRRMQTTWKTFMNSLGYGDDGLENSLGLRPHLRRHPAHKSKLLRYTNIRKTAKGEVKELNSFLDIMHRIFRHSLFPRVGNFDMVHGHLVDMLLMCEKEKGKTTVLDVSHVMWSELGSAVYGRKVPIYAPMIYKLIMDTW